MAESLQLAIDEFRPLSKDILKRSLRFHNAYFSPQYYGVENIDPSKPTLFVGNHSIYGVIDSPLVFNGIYQHTGIFCRALADDVHYRVPVWRKIMIRGGAVPGSRESCSRLMAAGEHLIVFPGGAREVSKRKGEQHQLRWKNRTGFARMAIEYGYNIVPFASVGMDDAYTILYDANDFKSSWLGKRLLKIGRIRDELRGGDFFMPIARGIGVTTLPRPEKVYIGFGEPIVTSAYKGQNEDLQAQLAVRDQVATAIEGLITDLKSIRAEDGKRSVMRRLLTRV